MHFLKPIFATAVVTSGVLAADFRLRAADTGLAESVIFTNGSEYPVFRIPAIVRANNGDLLAFCEGRASASDGGNIDMVLKRSSDGGLTWGPLVLVHEEGGAAPITIGNPAPVVDRTTGNIHLLFCRENDTVFHTVSTDNGLTWAAPNEITSAVKKPGWGWYATGPVHGIQLSHGSRAGRLVIPANHRIGAAGSDSGAFGAQILYSDDHGATWHMDAAFEAANGAAPNETTLVEVTPAAPDGGSRIYINSRDFGSDPGNRSEAWSADGGASYAVPYDGNPHFVTPLCQGSLLRFSSIDGGDAKNRIVFSSPNGGSRSNGSIWVSTDEAVTWSGPKPIRAGNYAYSDMVRTADGHLGIMFETGPDIAGGAIHFIRASEDWIDAPPPPAENPGAAFWNLEETAPGDSCSTAQDAIPDVDPAGNDLNLTATSPFLAVAGAPAFGGGRGLSFANSGGLRITDPESANRFDYGSDDSFTIEIVCRVPAASTDTDALVAKDLSPTSPSWWLRLENGKPRFLVSDNSKECFISAATAVNDGQWHHVAAVRDVTNPAGRKLRLYIDGSLSAEIADTTTGSLANAQALWIGRFNAAGRDLTGDIDFVRISPDALGPADFAGKNTQFDADRDAIPDHFERFKSGSLSPLGPGDFDSDSRCDLLEFATGSDPRLADAATQEISRGENFVELRIRQRSLPAWLGLHLAFSEDMKSWKNADSIITLAAIDDELWQRTDRIEHRPGDPGRGFYRYSLRSNP